jgi:Tfp pilus assembly protein PilF
LAATTTPLKTGLTGLLIALILVACGTPEPVLRTDQYHKPEPPASTVKPLNGLQLKALQLMNQQQYEEAISYLQRAIKVEPRNPLNWHYLAQNYWHLHDFANCRAMIQRAIAYSQLDEDLMRANQKLLQQCSE